jgi:hypothetical protein
MFIKLSSTENGKRKYWRSARSFSAFVCPRGFESRSRPKRDEHRLFLGGTAGLRMAVDDLPSSGSISLRGIGGSRVPKPRQTRAAHGRLRCGTSEAVLPFSGKSDSRPSAATVRFDYFRGALQDNFCIADNPPGRPASAMMPTIVSLVAALSARSAFAAARFPSSFR